MRSAWTRTSTLWLAALVLLLIVRAATLALSSGQADWSPYDTYYVVESPSRLISFGVIFVICAAFYFWCERAWGGRYDDRLGIAHLALFSLGAALLFAAPYGLLSATGEMVTAAGQRSAIAWMNGISLAGAVAFLTGGVAWVLVIVRGLHPPRPAEAA